MKVNAKEIKRRDYEIHLTETELKNIISEYLQKSSGELTPGAIRNKLTVQIPMQPALKIYFSNDAYHSFNATVKWYEAID